jgi:hypothetical protein
MDAKLRAFLRRQGVSDAALDQIEKGQVPDGDDVLHKGVDDPFAKLRECERLIQEIRDGLAKISQTNAHRAAIARGVELFNAGKINGHTVTHIREKGALLQ